jgi:hypothetical protein
MKKVNIPLIAILLSCSPCYSQLVIGKSFAEAKKELKSSFLKNNFHFLKQDDMGEQPAGGFAYVLRFKEEFIVFVNEYENVKWMTFESKKSDVYDKLKSIYEYPKWRFVKETDQNTREYSYLRYVITVFPYQWYLGSNGDVFKFMIQG